MTEDFNTYVNRKRLDRTHGNHIEIQAMCEMYNRPIEVFCYTKGYFSCFLCYLCIVELKYSLGWVFRRSHQYLSQP